jgi:hypothetical protein
MRLLRERKMPDEMFARGVSAASVVEAVWQCHYNFINMVART